MRIVSLIVPFFLYAGVKSDADADEKLWTQMFKRWIRNACKPDAANITASCVNTLIGDEQLTTLRTEDNHYSYKMNYQNNDSTISVFEFEQENDPFGETEEQESLTVAKWGGANILNNADFKPTFRKVRQKVFRWLKNKHNVTTTDLDMTGRRRRDTDEEMDAAVDDGFDDFIAEINELTKQHGKFNPVTVNFGKVKPTIAPTTPPYVLPHAQNADWLGCKSGWSQLSGTTTCFTIITPGGKPIFNEARDGCLARTSHLVRIESNAANHQIASSKSTGIWIGATDSGTENEWKDTNGESLSFTKWSGGNPDNKDNQDCGYVNHGIADHGSIGLWDDYWCNNKKGNVDHYACQYDDKCGKNEHNCDYYATCTNTVYSFTCACNIGFEGDGENCEDINECETNNHDCDINATCDNTFGSFTCTCNIGYEGDGEVCVDINECERYHDCSINGECMNTIGSHTCACNSGFLGDGKLCTVPCATFYDSYPTFNDGGESFSTGTFEVSNLATIDTGNQQEAVTNWKPSGNWNDKVSYVQLEPKCKLEAFTHNDYSQLTGSWRGSENLPNGHEMREGRENDKISSYKCTCSRESCESYYMVGKDVPKGCQVPKCDVVTYSLTDSWRRKQGNQMKYGFALNVAIPEEYWNKQGWSVLVRFNGVNVNSGSFQIWNANFFNFFRKSNAFEILIHQKHFTGNDLADKHSFLLVVDKMTMSDLPEFYFFTDRQKKHQCFDPSMHQRKVSSFDRAVESSSKTNTYEDVSFVVMSRSGDFRVRI